MVRLVLTWVDSPWAFELRPGLNKLGRNPTNDFRLSDPSVSSFHAELSVEGKEVRVRDLGSTNGTFINDVKIREALLTPEDTLRLGTVQLKVEEVIVTPRPAAVPAQEAPAREVALPKLCAYHRDSPAMFQCENCGGLFCDLCVKVVGHDRLNTMTVCPVCKGQCNHLSTKDREHARRASFLGRLTQTLKIPFAR